MDVEQARVLGPPFNVGQRHGGPARERRPQRVADRDAEQRSPERHAQRVFSEPHEGGCRVQ